MDNLEVTRLEGEPIIITRAKGHITAELVQETYRRIQDLRKDMPLKIYRLADYTQAETSFMDMMKILQTASQSGSQTLDPNVTIVYVSTSHWAKLATDALRQNAFRGRDIPIFTDEAEALAFIRGEIAKDASEGNA
jgi:hypothetical protein